jgi:beta-glucosidase
MDSPNEPQYVFGHGLSYTRFRYDDLRIETPVLPLDGTLALRVAVTNAGDRAADEIVQVYVRDVVASVTRPVKELKAFRRISLQPGERQWAEFAIPVRELGFHNQEMAYVVEPGAFKVWVGPDSTRGLEGQFEVVATTGALATTGAMQATA